MLFSWISWEEHTLQSRLKVLYAIVSRELVGSHREIAPQAVDTHERAGREMFVLDLCRRTSHLAAIDGTGDNSHRTDTRVVVVRLPRRATEGTAVRTSNDLGVERQLGAPFSCRPCQDLAYPEGSDSAGPGRCLNVNQGPCGAERSMKCCLMHRSQMRCPQPSSVAGRRAKQLHIEQIRWLGMPLSTNCSS